MPVREVAERDHRAVLRLDDKQTLARAHHHHRMRPAGANPGKFEAVKHTRPADAHRAARLAGPERQQVRKRHEAVRVVVAIPQLVHKPDLQRFLQLAKPALEIDELGVLGSQQFRPHVVYPRRRIRHPRKLRFDVVDRPDRGCLLRIPRRRRRQRDHRIAGDRGKIRHDAPRRLRPAPRRPRQQDDQNNRAIPSPQPTESAASRELGKYRHNFISKRRERGRTQR
jgi:hypothetical protein